MTVKEYIRNRNITTENIEIRNRKGCAIDHVTPATAEKYLDNEIISAEEIACHHFKYVGTDFTYGGGYETIDTYYRYVIKIKTKKIKKST